MTNDAWIRGWEILAATLRDRELKPEAQAIRGSTYRNALDHLRDEAWMTACETASRTLDWFPSIAQLLNLTTPSVAGALSKIYDEIVEHYSDSGHYGYRDVLDKYGRAAADAFVAAGGDEKFSWCELDERGWRAKNFINAGEAAAKDDPAAMLPGGMADPQLTRAQAHEIVHGNSKA